MRLIRGFEERALELVSDRRDRRRHPPLHRAGGRSRRGVRRAARGRPDHQHAPRARARAGQGRRRRSRMLAELCGRVTGLNRGRGGSMHAADLGVGVLGANGDRRRGRADRGRRRLGARSEGSGTVVVTFFGDGALNQGVLLETLNLAALWRLPVMFVCENNGYATTMPVGECRRRRTVAGRARGIRHPGAAVDGMDVTAVHAAAAERPSSAARDGGGPSLPECVTYRFEAAPHHGAADPPGLPDARRRSTAWRQRDPLACRRGTPDGGARADRCRDRPAARRRPRVRAGQSRARPEDALASTSTRAGCVRRGGAADG